MANTPRPNDAATGKSNGKRLVIIVVLVALLLIAAAAIFIPLLASNAS